MWPLLISTGIRNCALSSDPRLRACLPATDLTVGTLGCMGHGSKGLAKGRYC